MDERDEGRARAPWTVADLASLFAGDPEPLGDVDVEVPEGGDALRLVLRDKGDLEVYVSAAGEQVLCSTLLVEGGRVPRRDAFDSLLLAGHKAVPLSTFGITRVGDAEWYELFGSLSARSRADVVVEEVVTLAVNAVEAAEMVGEWIASGGDRAALQGGGTDR